MGFIDTLIDGGDTSSANQSKNPYAWRVDGLRSNHTTSRSYTGKDESQVYTYWSRVESRESYGHPVRLLGRTNRNIGGAFVHTKVSLDSVQPSPYLYRGGSTWRESTGELFPSGTFANDLLSFPASYAEAQGRCTAALPLVGNLTLDSRGATAIARTAPTTPLVDLSTSLAELLREGLPQTPGSAGNPGGEYLNVMFGYMPLFGDLTSLGQVVRNADKLLRQYERDSGKWIRRRYEFPEEITSTQGVQTNASLVGAGSGLSEIGTRTTHTVTRTKTWFEGAFTYYLPRDGWRRTVAELDYLYGVKPGIDTAWQLTGFSWLADYFANIGDVFTNLNSFSSDGLVLPYGYVMCEQHKTVQEDWYGPVWVGGTKQNLRVSGTKSYLTHQRRLANPFGFGLTDGDLSGRQQSILVALGISRL